MAYQPQSAQVPEPQREQTVSTEDSKRLPEAPEKQPRFSITLLGHIPG
jgi:hypothetical protein